MSAIALYYRSIKYGLLNSDYTTRRLAYRQQVKAYNIKLAQIKLFGNDVIVDELQAPKWVMVPSQEDTIKLIERALKVQVLETVDHSHVKTRQFVGT
jgi:hypothetical protein